MRTLVQLKWTRVPVMLLLFSICVYGWMLFKKVETEFFPVVSYFEIKKAKFEQGMLYISGDMYKKRDCDFIEVVAYDLAVLPPRLLTINFPRPKNTRETGLQSWGPWEIVPKSSNIKLIARNQCLTGRVDTVLFSGAITETAYEVN